MSGRTGGGARVGLGPSPIPVGRDLVSRWEQVGRWGMPGPKGPGALLFENYIINEYIFRKF